MALSLTLNALPIQNKVEPSLIRFCRAKKKVIFRIATENGELMHECSPEHLRKGTVRMT